MKDLVEFPLKVLNIWGYLVANQNSKTIIIQIIIELSVVFTFIVSTVNYFYSHGIDEVTENLQGHSGWFNTFVKLTWCIYYKSEFLNLFEKRKDFWNTNTCSTAAKRNVSWLLNTVNFLQKAFVCQCVAVLAFLVLCGIIKYRLPYGAFYISVDPLMYFIVWVANALSVVGGVTVMIAFDCLFMGLCYEVIAQFKILYDHFERLDVENVISEEELEEFVDKFKLYSKHHKFLLRYIQDIKDCFSVIYLFQYLTTAPTCCTYMYVGMESSVFMKKIVMIVLAFNVICEFALYCIPAAYMTEEASKIGTAIYNSNWYGRHYNKLKKSIQLKIQDAQQEIRITSLGGLVDVNLKSLIVVVRTSFSICTVLRNLKK